jgi:hypothetical protein
MTNDCLKKKNIKIYIKTAPACFSAVTPSSGNALLVLAKVTVVKIANYGTSVCGDVAVYVASTDNALLEDGFTALRHVGVILM